MIVSIFNYFDFISISVQGPQRRITPPPPYSQQQQHQQQTHPNNSLIPNPNLMHSTSTNSSHLQSQNSNVGLLPNSTSPNNNTNSSNTSSTNGNNNNNNSTPSNGRRNNNSNHNSNNSSQRVINHPSTSVKGIVVRYNRRNNPELEKRRIHHCDFLGKFFFNFISVRRLLHDRFGFALKIMRMWALKIQFEERKKIEKSGKK